MSKKHFNDFAKSVAALACDADTRRMIACMIADVCAAHSPRFDYGRFLTACGVRA